MSQRSVEHATFEIERIYDAAPSRVFDAFADPASKMQWFGTPELALDFRVGGREHFTAPMPDGRVFGYDGHYYEIVPGTRIVYGYTVDFDQARISVSLATVAISAGAEGTRLLYTEQAAYLDGLDTPADRERGTREEFDRLDAVLAGS
jgi:uncharacterized protein YndB with AHSA1/START domain